MGSDLKAGPAGKLAMSLVYALRDPDGASLDRIQIVKFKLDLAKEIPLKTQERAYTSPIWYTP